MYSIGCLQDVIRWHDSVEALGVFVFSSLIVIVDKMMLPAVIVSFLFRHLPAENGDARKPFFLNLYNMLGLDAPALICTRKL